MRIIHLNTEKIVLAIGEIDDYSHELTPAEKDIWIKLNQKRQREFSSSRHLAKALMQDIGKQPLEVLKLEDGRPLWPAGITGSISHSETICFVGISEDPDLHIGIDVQKIITINVDFARRVLTNEELDRMVPKDAWSKEITVLFSIKESIVKLASNLGERMGFKDITVLLDQNHFRAQARDGMLQFNGVFRVIDNFVYSGALLKHSRMVE